jgi:hypothetical protein
METDFGVVFFDFERENQDAVNERIAERSPYYDRALFPRRVLLAASARKVERDRHWHVKFTFAIADSPETAAHFIASCSAYDRQWYYVVEKDRPVHAYADFDLAHDATDAEKYTRESFLEMARDMIARFERFTAAWYSLADLDSYGAAAAEWRWFDASTSRKHSLHAHSRLLFPSVDTYNEVVTAFLRYLLWAERYEGATLTRCFFTRAGVRFLVMDTSVYTKRPFRTPYSRKTWDDSNWLLPLDGRHRRDQVDDLLWCMPHALEPGERALPTAKQVRKTRKRCAVALLLAPPRADLYALAQDLHDLLVSVWRSGNLGPAQACEQWFKSDRQEERATRAFCSREPSDDRALWTAMVAELVAFIALHTADDESLYATDMRGRLLMSTGGKMLKRSRTLDTLVKLTGIDTTVSPVPPTPVTGDFSIAMAFCRAHLPSVRRDRLADDEWRSFCASAAHFLPIPDCLRTISQMRLAKNDPFGAGATVAR